MHGFTYTVSFPPATTGSADLLEAEHPELAVTVLHAGTWGGG